MVQKMALTTISRKREAEAGQAGFHAQSFSG
jgi:hypothetical protein